MIFGKTLQNRVQEEGGREFVIPESMCSDVDSYALPFYVVVAISHHHHFSSSLLPLPLLGYPIERALAMGVTEGRKVLSTGLTQVNRLTIFLSCALWNVANVQGGCHKNIIPLGGKSSGSTRSEQKVPGSVWCYK